MDHRIAMRKKPERIARHRRQKKGRWSYWTGQRVIKKPKPVGTNHQTNYKAPESVR